MGIESDKVVYEYLSRVGDVAQQRQLPSAARMRLVAQLRDEIDRRRAKAPVDSPAAVRRIIDRLGDPDDLVTAAGGAGSAVPEPPPAAVPVQRDPDPREPSRRGPKSPRGTGRGLPKGLRRVVPRPRPAEPPAPAAAPPHLASAQELGDSAVQPDWWRVDGMSFGPGESVPGFVGGVEIPDLLKPPPRADAAPERKLVEFEPEPEEAEAEEGTRRRFLPSPGTWSNPLLLLAAALLVAGAVLGNLLALGVGWLIAYASRRLTPAEVKWAVMVLPGLALAGGFTWLWGRTTGRWGTPIPEGHMNEALGETWPWVLRAAAIASAAFLVWRSQKER
ncbi:hypothetical protein ACWC10_18005 [Streptomyces sp. NPDC001595]|uniref:hypothetical protein n=1 Tax=Streptomyces sp. NPDC001532 TaxID=3154520 RepID=UPI003324EBDE